MVPSPLFSSVTVYREWSYHWSNRITNLQKHFSLGGGGAAKDKVREIVGERRAGWDISGHKMRSHERKGGPQLAASKKMVTLDP